MHTLSPLSLFQILTTGSSSGFLSCLQEHYLKVLHETAFNVNISREILPELNKEVKLKRFSLKNAILQPYVIFI